MIRMTYRPEALGDLVGALLDTRRLVHDEYCETGCGPDDPELPEDHKRFPRHCEECKQATAALAKARGQS